MQAEYNLSKLKSHKNPYAKDLNKDVTVSLSLNTIDYFQELAEKAGIPYEVLIRLYLQDCVLHERKIDLSWREVD